MDVMTYVKESFGTEQAERLARIGIGGANNKKGSEYENFYAATKICCLGATLPSADLQNYHISTQEIAFVDDLCVRNTAVPEKINYQAKNSEGGAASWTDDMALRFKMQRQIDTEHHRVKASTQVLLVSSPTKAAANDEKIPLEMKSFSTSEHFPYMTSATQLVMGYAPLREALCRLCGAASLSNAEAAFKLVLGEWCGENAEGRTVADVLSKAKANSHPDLFANFAIDVVPTAEVPMEREQAIEEPPSWLSDLLAAFKMGPIAVECGAFIVSYNGMSASVAADTHVPAADTLQKLGSQWDVILFLLSLAGEELNHQSPQ